MFYGLLFAYDEVLSCIWCAVMSQGIVSDDTVLAAAVWRYQPSSKCLTDRNLFSHKRNDVTFEELVSVVEYIRRQVCHCAPLLIAFRCST